MQDVVCAEQAEEITGQLSGSRFLWARARFDQKSVEVNWRNKLTVEVVSKLKQSVELSSVELVTNKPDLNRVIDLRESDDGFVFRGFQFNRDNPIKLEKEFMVDSEFKDHGFVSLNLVKLNLFCETGARVSIELVPSLAPTQKQMEDGITRLNQLVVYEIQQAPD
jgi:hypothetical protein